jgi:hypothetical protein
MEIHPNTKKRPAATLRAQFDTTISPIADLEDVVKQICCAILCDSATKRDHSLSDGA